MDGLANAWGCGPVVRRASQVDNGFDGVHLSVSVDFHMTAVCQSAFAPDTWLYYGLI